MTVTATPTPTPRAAEPQPIILDDAAIELNGHDLKCLASHVEISPDVATNDITTFCGTVTYPGLVTWHFVLTLYQSFDPGGTDEVLQGCMDAGGPVEFCVTPRGSQPVSATNPKFCGEVIPQPYTIFAGDAGAPSTIDIDWTMTGPPTRQINGTRTVAGQPSTPTAAAPDAPPSPPPA